MLYSSRHNFHLDPAPDGAAGGAANPGSPVGGDAAPAFDASQYVPKADFDRISNDYTEFRQTAEQRFQDYDSRLPKPEKKEVKTPKEPDFESGDYDANKPGEIQRFFRELADFRLDQKLAERDRSTNETQAEQKQRERIQSAQDAHSERADSFRAANPDYDPNKSILLGHDGVALAVLKSPYSAHIHNYLQKNPAVVGEIRKLAQTDPAEAVMTIGMIAAQFKAQESSVPGKKSAAAAMPTAGGFGSGKASGAKQPTKEEIFKSWNS